MTNTQQSHKYSVAGGFQTQLCYTHSGTIRIAAKYTRIDIEHLNVLGDPEVTASIYRKSRNLPNADTQNYSTDLR